MPAATNRATGRRNAPSTQAHEEEQVRDEPRKIIIEFTPPPKLPVSVSKILNSTYVTVRHPDTGEVIPLHRLIAEDVLGRPLKPEEIVHHRNRNKADNRPSNLVVFPSSAEHLRLHAAEVKARHEVDPTEFGGVRVLDNEMFLALYLLEGLPVHQRTVIPLSAEQISEFEHWREAHASWVRNAMWQLEEQS